MPRTTAIEDAVSAAIIAAIEGITTHTPQMVYPYPKADLGSLALPYAMVVVDSTEPYGRADDNKKWEVRVGILLVAQVQDVVAMKAWVQNALEADESLGNVASELVRYEPWEFGYPIGASEGKYGWVQTVVTARANITKGKNIESA